MPRERLPIGEIGSISTTKLENGNWQARGYIRDKDGKRRGIKASAPTKAKSITRLKAKASTRVTPTTTGLHAQTTIKQAATMWLEILDRSKRKPATKRTYEQATRLHIIPLIGELTITEATPTRLNTFLHDAAQHRTIDGVGIGGITAARHAKVCLGLIFKMCVQDGALTHSPVIYTDTPATEYKPVKALTVEDIRAIRQGILAWGEVRTSGPPRNARLLLDFVDVLAGTGARPGEILALSWENVSLATGTIFITSTLTQVKGEGLVVMATPKSVYSERGLKMPVFVEAVLSARRAHADVSAPVFSTRTGNHISDSNMRRIWRAAKPAGYEHVKFSDYRKAVATLIERAEGMEAAGKALGHSSPEITRRYYVEREGVVDFTKVLGELLG